MRIAVGDDSWGNVVGVTGDGRKLHALIMYYLGVQARDSVIDWEKQEKGNELVGPFAQWRELII